MLNGSWRLYGVEALLLLPLPSLVVKTRFPVVSETLLDVPVTRKQAVLLPGVTVAVVPAPPRTVRAPATPRRPAGCAALTQLVGKIAAMPAGNAGGAMVTVAL